MKSQMANGDVESNIAAKRIKKRPRTVMASLTDTTHYSAGLKIKK